MTRTSFRCMLPGLFLLPVITLYAGGWATITVEDLPDHVVARQPVNLTFAVRQHGTTLLSGMPEARVEARAGSLEVSAAAIPGRAPGRYTATLNLPQSGEWTITIHSGFQGSRVTLLPVTAIDPGARAPHPPPDMERGRRLFVAKGCVTCHLHRDVDGSGTLTVGPELTGRRYPPDYLKQFLANPAIASSSRGGEGRMPNLNLREREIAALVAFINGDRQALR